MSLALGSRNIDGISCMYTYAYIYMHTHTRSLESSYMMLSSLAICCGESQDAYLMAASQHECPALILQSAAKSISGIHYYTHLGMIPIPDLVATRGRLAS